MVKAVIDTGLTGYLALPTPTISSLGLPWIFRDTSTLGDDSAVVFDIYRAILIWDGNLQVGDVVASEADPLTGMRLLYGFKVEIDAVEGGRVMLQAL